MSELFEIPQNFKGTAWADDEKYQQMYRQSLENPEAFWAERRSGSTGSKNGIRCWTGIIMRRTSAGLREVS